MCVILLRHGCLNAEVGAVEAYYAQIVLLYELAHLIYKALSSSSIEVPVVCVNAITLQVIDNIARIPLRASITTSHTYEHKLLNLVFSIIIAYSLV